MYKVGDKFDDLFDIYYKNRSSPSFNIQDHIKHAKIKIGGDPILFYGKIFLLFAIIFPNPCPDNCLIIRNWTSIYFVPDDSTGEIIDKKFKISFPADKNIKYNNSSIFLTDVIHFILRHNEYFDREKGGSIILPNPYFYENDDF